VESKREEAAIKLCWPRAMLEHQLDTLVVFRLAAWPAWRASESDPGRTSLCDNRGRLSELI
jgi:hypothetical protein